MLLSLKKCVSYVIAELQKIRSKHVFKKIKNEKFYNDHFADLLFFDRNSK